MIYATAQNLLNWFDSQELAQLSTPKRYPVVDAVLLELTVSGGDRSAYTALEIEAADVALVVINESLTAATNLIDSYLAQQYSLPLAQSQVDTSPIPRTCGDIARYELSDDQAAEPVTQRYDRALRWLLHIAKGAATLGPGEPEPAGGGAVVVSGPDRIFTRNSMKGL